jgi:hypothetical protein
VNPRELDAAAGDAAWHAVRSIKSAKGLTSAQKHRFWAGVIEFLEVLIADAREKPSNAYGHCVHPPQPAATSTTTPIIGLTRLLSTVQTGQLVSLEG